MKLTLTVFLMVFACAQPAHSFLITFTNSSEYANDNVYVWFQSGGTTYDLKIPGQTTNITQGTSFKLSDLSTGVEANYIDAGRIYFSLGTPLATSALNAYGMPTQQPGVNPGDIGYTNRFDWIELANLNTAGDIADLSSMNQFAVPLTMQLKTNHVNLVGAGTFAGWKGNTDQQIVSALAPLASPTGSNIFFNNNQFIRVNGATSYLSLYHNTTNDTRSMYAYLDTIRSNQTAHGSLIITGRYDATTTYAYSASIDTNGSYVLTKIGGSATATNILLPAVCERPGNTTVTLAESIYESNPWYSLDGGPTNAPTSDLYKTICRDLYAALNIGYVDSDHVIQADETTDASLVGKHIYELNTDQMRKLKIGFSKVNNYYNLYADGIAELSDSYGYAYSDWNENLSKVAVKPNAIHNGQIADELNITIYGSQTLSIPEPSSGILCLVGAGAAFLFARRRRK